MGWIAKIPGTFSVFRLIYRRLYPAPGPDVRFRQTLTRSGLTPIRNIMIVSPRSCADSNVPREPAEGNIFFEIWQSARERFGAQRVLLHQRAPGDSGWAQRLVSDIVAQNPTHVIFHGEENPNGKVNAWPGMGAALAGGVGGRTNFSYVRFGLLVAYFCR